MSANKEKRPLEERFEGLARGAEKSQRSCSYQETTLVPSWKEEYFEV
jgi:hypothetical protein